MLRRIGFIKDKLPYIPSHDSLLWHFISLHIEGAEIISSQFERLSFISNIASGGPYTSEYVDSTIVDLVQDYDKITLTFKNKIKEDTSDMSFEEMDDLVDLLS